MKKKSEIPADAACSNCRFCVFSDSSDENICRKIGQHTVPEALCSDWCPCFQSVFEFQKAYPKKKQREEVLQEMTDEEIDVLIATCGTIQGKIYYAGFKKKR